MSKARFVSKAPSLKHKPQNSSDLVDLIISSNSSQEAISSNGKITKYSDQIFFGDVIPPKLIDLPILRREEIGEWKVSPVYDLTFSSGPNGEHFTLIMGEGNSPGKSHLLELAKIAGIKQSKALEIIEEVKTAVNNWPLFATEADVTGSSKEMIQSYLHKSLKKN